MAFDT